MFPLLLRTSRLFIFSCVVHLNVCEVDEAGCACGILHTCHPGPIHPCDCCPDCNLPHAHHIDYCQNLAAGTLSATCSEASASSSNNGSSGSGNKGSGNGRQGQTPSRIFSAWIFVAAAAVVSTLIGAMILRKRVRIYCKSQDTFTAPISFSRFQETDTEGKEKNEQHALYGSIAKRLGLGAKGVGASEAMSVGSATMEGSTGPDFIEMDNVEQTAPNVSESQYGFELDGPIRPSSSYAV
jgi:hypothetical protein